MKYCAYCGKEMHDEARFCESCGAAATAESTNIAEEKEFLDTTHRFLRYERLAWRITGVVLLVLCILILGCGLLALAGSAGAVMDGDAIASLGLGVAVLYLVIYGILFLPIAIIGLVAAQKIDRYLGEMYNDVRPTAARCGSVGMIVFTAFFNEIALIFYIINFVRMKTNKQLVERITLRQQTPPRV